MLCGCRCRSKRKGHQPRRDMSDNALRMDAIRVSKVRLDLNASEGLLLIQFEQVDDVFLDKAGKRYEGTLHLTAHHLIFTGTDIDEVWVSKG